MISEQEQSYAQSFIFFPIIVFMANDGK